VNPPPSGGACAACLRATGASAACIKSGRALADTFRLACSGWADADLPLQYRFGFRSVVAGDATGGDDAESGAGAAGAWFAFSREAGVDLVLAAGEFDALAVVRIELG
jgi:hypothetical protein